MIVKTDMLVAQITFAHHFFGVRVNYSNNLHTLYLAYRKRKTIEILLSNAMKLAGYPRPHGDSRKVYFPQLFDCLQKTAIYMIWHVSQ